MISSKIYYDKIVFEKYAKGIWCIQNTTHAFPCITGNSNESSSSSSIIKKDDGNSSNSSSMTYICIQFVCDDGNEAL